MSRFQRGMAAPIAAILMTLAPGLRPAEAGPDGEGPTVADQASHEAGRWLEKLEARGKRIESFEARVVYEKLNHLLSDRQTRIGRIVYSAADPERDRPARFAIHFKQLIVNDALRRENMRWIFDGAWLVERQVKENGRKLFIKRRIVPEGERMNPLSIDGPFPVPIGQNPDDILARFHARVIKPDARRSPLPQKPTAPPLHLRLTPRGKGGKASADGDAESAEATPRQPFDRVDLWFNRETLLPLRVRSEDDEERTTITLSDMRVNKLDAARTEELFDTTAPPHGSGWDVEIKPWSGSEGQ